MREYMVLDKVQNMLRPYLETCPQLKYEMKEGRTPPPPVAPLNEMHGFKVRYSLMYLFCKLLIQQGGAS